MPAAICPQSGLWLLVALCVTAACASFGFGSPWKPGPDGRLVHARHGYSLVEPGGAGWRRVEVEGAALAYRGPSGSTLSVIRECGRAAVHPSIRARQLLIGLRDREILGGHPAALGGRPAYLQWLRARGENARVELKALTVIDGNCTFDFVLVARSPEAFLRAERVFDDWWSTFESPRPALEPEAAAQREPERAIRTGARSAGVRA